MNWIKFVENNHENIHLPRIGRSLYCYAPENTSNTLVSFLRETNRSLYY